LERSPDSETNDKEAKQQTDTEDKEIPGRDFENLGDAKQDLADGEDANEDLEARETSADDLDEVSDAETIQDPHGEIWRHSSGSRRDHNHSEVLIAR
jgi:hypothetical protein